MLSVQSGAIFFHKLQLILTLHESITPNCGPNNNEKSYMIRLRNIVVPFSRLMVDKLLS